MATALHTQQRHHHRFPVADYVVLQSGPHKVRTTRYALLLHGKACLTNCCSWHRLGLQGFNLYVVVAMSSTAIQRFGTTTVIAEE